MKLLLKAMVSLTLLTSLPALAQGDADRGKEKSGLCAACHGADGNSTVALWPKLAGQHAAYLELQTALIRSGARAVPEMAGIAAGLSDQDISDLAAYFAAQDSKPAVADPALIGQGELLYRAGNPKTGVPACMACHGPAGEGNPLAGFPALAGQHAVYTAKALTRFKSGTTWGEDDTASTMMAGAARSMSDSEIAAVSSYIQGLYRKGSE